MRATTRKEAISLGQKLWFTGVHCKNGHIDFRRLSNGNCLSCEKDTAQRSRFNQPERHKIYGKAFYQKNTDIIKNKNLEYYRTNRQEALARKKAYRQANKAAISADKQRRRSLAKMAEGSFSKDDVLRILNAQKWKCAEPNCKKDIRDNYHVDHIMPLALGGSNWPCNIQGLCEWCNKSKNAKHPLDWARQNGRLL